MSPLVDVVLPTHERPHTLPFAIQSVLRQSVSDLVLDVVGDGCPDEVEGIVSSFRDPRVRLHRFPKGMGFGIASRNAVLRRGRAPFVAYMTDDDLWFPDHLEIGLLELERKGTALVALRPGNVHPSGLDPHFFAFDWWRGDRLRRWFVGSATFVHHRWMLERLGYWDETLRRFVDRELFRRARASSFGAAFVDRMTVLRFYARHWDGLYSSCGAPPQRRYLELLGEPAFRDDLRRRAARGPRDLATRRRQLGDFLRFAFGSGPRLLRYAWERRGRGSSPSPGGGA